MVAALRSTFLIPAVSAEACNVIVTAVALVGDKIFSTKLERLHTSVPAIANAVPLVPTKSVSVPAPPVTESTKALAVKRSAVSKYTNESSPAPASIVSAPPPPVMVSTTAPPPVVMVSAPAVPKTLVAPAVEPISVNGEVVEVTREASITLFIALDPSEMSTVRRPAA